MKSPLKIGAVRAPKNRLRIKAGRIESGRAWRIAGLSAATAIVLGVAAGSALFVDYLADRARASDGPVAVKPAVAKAVEVSPEVEVASIVATPAQPAVVPSQPQAEPIEARLPDAAAIAKVAVGPEHAIEMPADDPTAEPVLAYADDSPDETLAGEDATMTGAISPEMSSSDMGSPEPQPKRKKKTAKAQPVAEEETEVASLPGVNVSGMAGYPADDDDASDSTVRTVVKSAKAAAATRGAISGTARVKSAVNMRSSPKKGSSVLGVVPAGASVSVVSCDGWCQISWNGRKGWVYKSFLAAAKPQKAAASNPARKSSSRL